jgi:hypothetical protein
VKHSWDEPGKVVNGKGGTSGIGVVSDGGDVNSACRYVRWVGEPLSGKKCMESVIPRDVPCVG